MKTTTSKLADLGPPVEPTLRRPADSAAKRQVSWRLALDTAWERTMDQVIALSKASCGLTSDDDGIAAGGVVRASVRLQARTGRAFDELAAIEDAIARIDAGTYGICAGCDLGMSDEWLATKPTALYCPDCALRLVSWQPQDLPMAPPPPREQRARPKNGPGVRRRSQLGRPASAG